MNLLNGAVKVRARLIVNVHHHRTRLCRLGDVTLGVDNHEMHVKRFLAHLSHRVKHGETERDIRNEDTIHDVHVKPVSLTTVNHLDVRLEVNEIGGKQRRRNYCHRSSVLVKAINLRFATILKHLVGVCYLTNQVERLLRRFHVFRCKILHRHYCALKCLYDSVVLFSFSL